ncbi:MAG: LuxR C-terminal-related transcriptional regulator [Tepidiformaceae bacterium]
MTTNSAARPSMRERLAIDYGWTERQREVLGLIAAGKTNTEIAEILGLSLAGAKWHVSEILSKLDAESREEAADYWRRYNGLAPRFARIFRGASALATLRVTAVTAGIAFAGLGVVAAVVLLNQDEGSPSVGTPPAAGNSPTAVASASPTTQPTPAASRIITLDGSPRPAVTVVTRKLGPPPPSQFSTWDGVSTVIYDVKTGVEMNLGPGSQRAAFSPDSTKAAWAAGETFVDGHEVFVIELVTGVKRSLGHGRMAAFRDDQTVGIYKEASNEVELVDLATGAHSPSPDGSPFSSSFHRLVSGWGFELRVPSSPDAQDRYAFELVELATQRVVLQFEALAAVPAGPREIAVATAPVSGLSNIYVVNIDTGVAEFVATAQAHSGNWPFAANADSVIWTDGFCAQPRGQVRIFDRKTRQLSVVDDGATNDEESYLRRFVRLTPSGLIAAGPFGAKYLIDPGTLQYVSVIPSSASQGAGDVNWSPDYRYASHGPTGGHGGLCAG